MICGLQQKWLWKLNVKKKIYMKYVQNCFIALFSRMRVRGAFRENSPDLPFTFKLSEYFCRNHCLGKVNGELEAPWPFVNDLHKM